MKPYEFEQLVCDHYRQKGYRVQTTSASNDYGIDVFAEKKGEKIAVQVKMYGGSTRKVNRQTMMELYGAAAYFDCTKAVLATDGEVLTDAKEVAHKLGIDILFIQPDRKISMPIWITSSADRGIRRPKGRRPGLQNIRKNCRESSSLTSTTTRQTLRTFTSAMSACFPGAKGVPKRKRVTSGAMHRARRSRSGVMRVRPSGTVRFNEKQKMSENNLVRL